MPSLFTIIGAKICFVRPIEPSKMRQEWKNIYNKTYGRKIKMGNTKTTKKIRIYVILIARFMFQYLDAIECSQNLALKYPKAWMVEK